MNYELPWRRKHPGHLVYLIDLSGSMARKQGDKRLVDIVFNTLRRLFSSLVAQCESGDDVLDYFSVTVIGYNSDVFTLLECRSSEQLCDFVNDANARGWLFDTSDGKEASPRWQTYMADAFDAAATDIRAWIARQQASGKQVPAPVVINITDGIPEEKGLTADAAASKTAEAARRLRSISTPDGDTLLFNIHYTPSTDVTTMALPSTEPADRQRKLLFSISSKVPAKGVETARILWPNEKITADSRMMISNETDARNLLKFIDFGSSLSMPDGASFAETPKPD